MWDAIQNYVASQGASPKGGGGVLAGLQNWGAGVQQRMAGQGGQSSIPAWKIYPGSGLRGGSGDSMRQSMMDGGDTNLMTAFQRMKQMFSPQMQAPAGIKYQRNVAPSNYGANSPTPMGDMRQTMADPYSSPSSYRMNNNSVGDYYGY